MTEENQLLSRDAEPLFDTILGRSRMVDYFQSMILDDEVYVVSTVTKDNDGGKFKIYIEKRSTEMDIIGVCRVFWRQDDASDYLAILESNGIANRITSKVIPYRVKDLCAVLSRTDEKSYSEFGKGIRAEAYTVVGQAMELVDIFWTREHMKHN
jgi:hypothetical protein